MFDPTSGCAHSNLQAAWRLPFSVLGIPYTDDGLRRTENQDMTHAGLDPQDSFGAAEKNIFPRLAKGSGRVYCLEIGYG